MSNVELATKLGDVNAYLENIKDMLSRASDGKDIETSLWMVLKTDVDNASKITNELYTEYYKDDAKK